MSFIYWLHVLSLIATANSLKGSCVLDCFCLSYLQFSGSYADIGMEIILYPSGYFFLMKFAVYNFLTWQFKHLSKSSIWVQADFVFCKSHGQDGSTFCMKHKYICCSGYWIFIAHFLNFFFFFFPSKHQLLILLFSVISPSIFFSFSMGELF